MNCLLQVIWLSLMEFVPVIGMKVTMGEIEIYVQLTMENVEKQDIN